MYNCIYTFIITKLVCFVLVYALSKRLNSRQCSVVRLRIAVIPEAYHQIGKKAKSSSFVYLTSKSV